MPVRLVVTFNAAAGKGAELAKAFSERAALAMKENGCEQFEVFRSVSNPDKVVLLERWADQAALDAHAKGLMALPPLPEGLVAGGREREDYEYNRTR
jgi:quinol monooxygenase YgiN